MTSYRAIMMGFGNVGRAVAPTPLPLEHPLARLRNTAMGVLVHTDLLVSVEGDAPLATAQAMLPDVVNIGREHRASS